jgi:hypothetical protein
MKFQDNFKKKYGIDAIDFVEKADLEYFGLAKTIGLENVIKQYADKIRLDIQFNGEFYKDLVQAFAEAGKRFPNNEKVTLDEGFELNITPTNPPVPKSKGVLEDFKDIVSDDFLRPKMQCVYISEDGYLVGTDAHKLIKYKSNDFYEYAGKLIKLDTYIKSKGKKIEFIDEKYVLYEQVIPKDNPNKVENLSTYSFYNFTKSVIATKKLQTSEIFNVNFDFKGTTFSFNPIILMDTLHFALCKGFEFFNLEYSTPNRAIVLDFPNKSEGIVMPIIGTSLVGTKKYTIEEINSYFKLSKTSSTKTSAKAPTKTDKYPVETEKEVPYKKYEGGIDKTTYIPRRDISYIVLRNGEKLSANDIIDGFYRITKMATGGGVGILPPQGTLITKDKKLKLDYTKVGDNYEFTVYEGESNPVENYSRTSFKRKDKNVVTMNYNQFINYIYSEGYIDDKKMAEGGGVKHAKGGLVNGDNVAVHDFGTLKSMKKGVFKKYEGDYDALVEIAGKEYKVKAHSVVKFKDGGGVGEEGIDLFEDYENIPPKVQKILDKNSKAFEDGDYKGLAKAHKELVKIGYTFDYGLDGGAYDLRPIGTKGKSESEEDVEEGAFKKGGKVTPAKQKKVAKVMKEWKKGELHIGQSDKIVKDQKQAVAIALSEAGLSKPKAGWKHKRKK